MSLTHILGISDIESVFESHLQNEIFTLCKFRIGSVDAC